MAAISSSPKRKPAVRPVRAAALPALAALLLSAPSAAGPSGSPPSLHYCPNTTFALDTLCKGVTEQTTCFLEFDYCKRDTFYQDDLLKELAENFRLSTYAALALVDSVHYINYIDTFGTGPNAVKIPMHRESLWVSIPHVLKGGFPERKLFFVEEFGYDSKDTVTYRTLVDTPLVVAFNNHAEAYDLGLRPTQDCLLEPTAYMLTPSGIVRRGRVVRKPGISVPFREYLSAIGHSDSLASLYPENPGPALPLLAIRHGGDTLILESRGRLIARAYDLAGRFLESRTRVAGAPWDMDDPRHASGLVLLRLQGDRWRQGARLMLQAGSAPVADRRFLGERPKLNAGRCRD